jgi:hypothetical protein
MIADAERFLIRKAAPPGVRTYEMGAIQAAAAAGTAPA